MADQKPVGKGKLILAGLAGVVALVLGGLVVLNTAGASDLATVRTIEPVVRVQQPGAKVFAPVTSSVTTNAGAKVRTGPSGMAEISYFDGSLTRLGPDTDYELVELDDVGSRTVIGRLDAGRSFHRVVDLTGSSDRFEVHTTNAVAAVRGTRFVTVCPTSNECIIGVVDGEVELRSPDTGERVTLRAGEEITVSRDGEFSEVRPLDLENDWLELNLDIETIDIDELAEELFGPDTPPTTVGDTDPEETPPTTECIAYPPGDCPP